MTANVRNIEALREFRVQLLRFIEEVESTLQSMQIELLRGFEWIDQDRPQYWTIQTRKAFDLVAATRTAFNACRMRTVAGHRSACLEEKVEFEKAKRRLQYCQEQLEHVRRWSIKIHHDADEFRGRLAGVRRLLDAELPQALAFLEKSATILEQYAEIPSADSEPPDARQSSEN